MTQNATKTTAGMPDTILTVAETLLVEEEHGSGEGDVEGVKEAA